jgi:hypothetical protein
LVWGKFCAGALAILILTQIYLFASVAPPRVPKSSPYLRSKPGADFPEFHDLICYKCQRDARYFAFRQNAIFSWFLLAKGENLSKGCGNSAASLSF